MNDTAWMLPTQAVMDREEGAEASLYEALHHLQDARRGQGKRYSLALILYLLALAKLAGQTPLSGATEWIRHRSGMLVPRFGLSQETMPCQCGSQFLSPGSFRLLWRHQRKTADASHRGPASPGYSASAHFSG